ncbi:MAG TPA: hypothetical protein VEI02_11750, partial [Planctomycetota bacterium]|nr:hypothetical protein [Planctomycetota bacterium]
FQAAAAAALDFLCAPGALGVDAEALLGRAHGRLALALAAQWRKEARADDEGLPEPPLDFPEDAR